MKIALQHGQIILAEIEPLRYEQLKRMGIFPLEQNHAHHDRPDQPGRPQRLT